MNLESLVITKESLGAGGFGTVFVGQLGKKKVAAKRLSQSEKEIDNLTREASKLKRLRHGKHITYTYGIILMDKNLYMVMEYCERGDLRNYLERNKESVTYEQKILFCRGILLGLLYCHSMKVFHGDIKCENVLLRKDLEPKLTDFGLSMTVDNIAYYKNLCKGSLYWTAPELFSIKEDEAVYQKFIADPYPCDVYSMGATFCEISYDGTTEFIDSNDEPDMDIMTGIVHPVPNDAFLEEIVNCCCQFERNERISLGSCFDMLEKVAEEQLSEPESESNYSLFSIAENEWKQIQKKTKAKTTQALPPSFILHRPADNLVVGLSNLSLLEWLCINDCADEVEYMVNLHSPDEEQIEWLYSISMLCRSFTTAELFRKKISEYMFLDLSKLIDNNPQQFIETIIKAGANFESDLLRKAVEKNYNQAVQTFVDLNVYSSSWVIHDAIKCRNTEAVRILATGGHFEARNENGDTPLLAAINTGDVEIVKTLLEHNADFHSRNSLSRNNAETEYQHTPLYRAAVMGNREILELLINAGSTIDTEDNEWDSLVQDLEQQDKSSIIQFISDEMKKKREKAKYTPLCTAIRNKQSDIVQKLIDDGADVNEQSCDRCLPLHWAIITGDERIVKILLEASANIDARTPNDKWNQYSPSLPNYFNEYTSLHIAIAKRHSRIVKLLIESGADFSAKNGLGQTITDIANNEDQKEVENIISDHVLTEPESLQKAIELMSIEVVGAISIGTVKAMVDKHQTDTDTISDCLCIAAIHGNIEAVCYFLQCKANVNVQFNGRSPLDAAASGGYVQVAQVLIDAGANVNVRNTNGRTPLFESAKEAQKKMLQFLIDKGADVNAEDKYGYTPIYHAEDIEIVQILINAGADINAKDINGRTPLFHYARKSQTKIVQLLVDKGVDINAKDKHDYAPIHYAKSREIMKILINAGADINIKDKYGESLLHQYVRKVQTEMVQLLMDKGADVNIRDKDGNVPIHYTKNRGIMEILIKAGADINAKDKYGETLLHRFVKKVQIEMVKFLVEKGADVNIRDKDGNMPIHYAKSTEIAQILISAGADINAENISGESPLHQYVKKAQTEMVQFLVDKGADVNIRDKDGNVPIHYAKSIEVVQILINIGADVNTKNRFEEAPFCQFVKKSQAEVVKFLVDKGVDVNAKDKNDCAPIHYAENREIVQILINAGADVNAKDKNGETLLHRFVRKVQTEMVKFLVENGANIHARDNGDHEPIYYARNKEIAQILINTGANVNAKRKYEESPLHRHVKEAQTEVVKFLVNKGADVHAKDNGGRTPIYYAKNTEIVQILINAGANVNIKNIFEETPLHWHVKEAQTEMVKFLVENGANIHARDNGDHEPIYYARNKEIAQILINTGANVNIKDKYEHSLLHQHAKESRTEMVKFLIDNGADINVRDKYDCASIHYAKSTEIVQILIKAGTDVNIKDKYGEPLLHRFVKEAQIEMVQFLIDKGVDVNARDKNDCAPIHYAENREIVQNLINAGANVNAKHKYEESPLHRHVKEAQTEVVQFLVDKGADVHTKDNDGRTPFHYAKSTEIMQILINGGADVNIKDKYGEPLLQWFINKIQTEVVQFLVDKGADVHAKDNDDRTPIYYAKNTEIVQNLINAGANVNAKHKYEESPLHRHVKGAQTEVVKFLVNKGADVHAKDNGGRTPIYYAKNTEIVQILINGGADVNTKDKYGEPLLQWFINKIQTEIMYDDADDLFENFYDYSISYYVRNREIIKLLINAGADVNIKDKYVEPLLHQCIKEAQIEMVQLLVDKGVDVNAEDKYGHTPIYYTKNREIVRILIDAGADVNIKNTFGESLLHQYVKEAQTEMVRFLIDKGADVNTGDEYGHTPIYYTKNREIVQILINAGADINAKNIFGESLLHQYVKEAQIEIIQSLVDKGTDVNTRDQDNCAPIHYVKNVEIMQILINSGADINVENKCGKTLFDILLEEQNRNLGNIKYQRKKSCELLEYLRKLNK